MGRDAQDIESPGWRLAGPAPSDGDVVRRLEERGVKSLRHAVTSCKEGHRERIAPVLVGPKDGVDPVVGVQAVARGRAEVLKLKLRAGLVVPALGRASNDLDLLVLAPGKGGVGKIGIDPKAGAAIHPLRSKGLEGE